MAQNNNTSGANSDTFDKSLNEDIRNFHAGPNQWTQARNAINNSKTGDLGALGNEPATLKCITLPLYNGVSYTIIGAISIVGDKWLIFSALMASPPLNNSISIDSEIGIFDASECSYRTIVKDTCLNFSVHHPIIGVSRPTSICTYKVYWDDGAFNPDRVLEINVDDLSANQPGNPANNIPWMEVCKDQDGTGQVVNDPLNPPANPITGCIICTPVTPSRLDCNKIRLARFIKTPCIKVKKGVGSGTLLNGSYLVAVAYSIKGAKIGDWFVSNVQAIFSHENTNGSIDVELIDTDVTYDDITVVIVSIINQQTVARVVGTYSTHQNLISIDVIQSTWIAYPVEQLPLRNPIIERTDAMYTINDVLIRVGPRSKFDFNYQPLANQIVTKWSSVEYPEKYYRNGGNKTGYLQDEIYPYFIRWIYDTGDKSSSYHIPGRPKFTGDSSPAGSEYISQIDGSIDENWLCTNTATIINLNLNNPLPDGGIEIADGYMGYWESTEHYPAQNPEIWNCTDPGTPWFNPNMANVYQDLLIADTDYDLCNKNIRHHRMPDQTVLIGGQPVTGLHPLDYYNETNQKIRILGVKFENIRPPVDNSGNVIPGIVGYEILRGSRNGNRTIIAKGIINNMGGYKIEGNITNRRGIYQNYPYNDLTLDPFLSQTETTWSGGSIFGGMGLVSPTANFKPLGGVEGFENSLQTDRFSKSLFSFHSPDTNFNYPYLTGKELRVYRQYLGDVTGKFEKSEKHPKEKLVTNLAFLIASICGIGIAALAANGKRTMKYIPPGNRGYSQFGFANTTNHAPTIAYMPAATSTNIGSGTGPVSSPKPLDAPKISLLNTGVGNFIGGLENTWATDMFAGLLGGIGTSVIYSIMQIFMKNAASTAGPVSTSAVRNIDQEDGVYKSTPQVARLFAGLPMFLYYYTEGTDSVLRTIRAFLGYRDFALRYHSHCFYDKYGDAPVIKRRLLMNESYIGPQITDFGQNYRINNLYRNSFLALETSTLIPTVGPREVTRISANQVLSLLTPDPSTNNPELFDPTQQSIGPQDQSNFRGFYYNGFTDSNAFYFGQGVTLDYQRSRCYYGAIKLQIGNLYGQLVQIAQLPASECVFPIDNTLLTQSTDTIFGGDIYVGRYTEKTTFFFFQDWLYDQPEGAQFNYPASRVLAWPRFWANFDRFETNDFTSSLIDAIASNPSSAYNNVTLPNDYYNLDGLTFGTAVGGIVNSSMNGARLDVRNAWFYLFNSGVRDFYCESEINLDLRDWGNEDDQYHYDHFRYTDLKAMFNTKIIQTTNYYKYDQSLSVAKLFNNYISWGNMQSRNYNPTLAETCFQYKPFRAIYSLPAIYESYADNWLTFLPNNYKDFYSKITAIKSINKSGAVIVFESAGPLMAQGLDQLQTDLGTKLTIGDGGLFSQPLQALANSEQAYEYGSCQNRLSIINTPVGLFWMCQNQGKIFQVGQSLKELSAQDLRWWLAQYLPYKLTLDFPDFDLTDNTISGIGCMATYDNENALLYFTKKDYKYSSVVPISDILYLGNNSFRDTLNTIDFLLGDPTYFEDVSWTISYDPKTGEWIGYHDWHPNLLLPGKNTFMSISNIATPSSDNNSIWIHNKRTDLYCNYYGVNYPFEVEFMVQTGQQVNTLRSVQYQLECYKYDQNQYDRFHKLDMNFDQAVIYNTEQCSGLLKLLLQPKNNLALELTYPIIQPVAPGWIEILFTKEENAYRFNQFWDTTADRGEFNPIAERMIWNTQNNGYVRNLNDNNLDYNKNPFQRKKFRHYQTLVLLSKLVPEIVGTPGMEYKLLVNITNVKFLKSPR